MRTQVGIVGAGPAGLVLAHLLHRLGIDSVVIEDRSRGYIERRIRAGVLEHGTVDLLTEIGLGDRLHKERMVHHGLELLFDGEGHRIALSELAGREISIYGQHELVKDLVAARLSTGRPLLFEVSDVEVSTVDPDRPVVEFTHEGRRERLSCDILAGCDGYHGVCRTAVPAGALTVYQRDYPYGWLGILAQAAPSSEELIYASHDRGFALHSMRSPEVTRLYLQVRPDEELAAWPDERIWSELRTRLSRTGGFTLHEGPILERGVIGLRSMVVEPMRYGRLFLAGDAAHVVPATGAKGLNLAIADVWVLAGAIADFYAGDPSGLSAYSDTCLRRVWRVQHFSWWMTSMLHIPEDDDGFSHRLRMSQLRYVVSSRAAATSLAENYVGLPLPGRST